MFQKTGVKLTILLVALATLLIACTATGVERAADTVAPTGGITVVGRGEAFGQPDEAYVQVGVDTFAEAVTDATAESQRPPPEVVAWKDCT